MKTCNFCGNININNKNVQYIYKHNNQFLIVNNVPCEECEFCGEQYFEAEVLKKIERNFEEIHFSGRAVKRELIVPVQEFVEIK